MVKKAARTYYELKHAVVGIAGLGGLGSNVSTAIARLGVGKMIIVDKDQVELSNLNRQQYSIDQIGKHKVDAMMSNLSKINYLDIEIESRKLRLEPGNIPEVFAGADVIAECLDDACEKQMLVETVLSKMDDTIVVAASGLAGYGSSNDIKTVKFNDRLVVAGDMVSGLCPLVPLTAARVGLVAYHQANAIAEILINSRREKFVNDSKSYRGMNGDGI